MGPESILIGKSKDIPRCSFVVVRIKSGPANGVEYQPDEMQELFVSDGSEASMLFGWGIACNSIKTRKTMMVFNPDEIVTFPEVEGDDEY
jgi:hypothetical protein